MWSASWQHQHPRGTCSWLSWLKRFWNPKIQRTDLLENRGEVLGFCFVLEVEPDGFVEWQIVTKQAEGRHSQARHWHGRKMSPREVHGSGDLSLGFASAKTQFCYPRPDLWMLISSSVHERGGPNSSFRCVDCYPLQETHFYQHAHPWQKQSLHQTITYYVRCILVFSILFSSISLF